MPKLSQDIDAGIERQSPGRDEPHRSHDTRDRGGVYVREQQNGQRGGQSHRTQLRRYGREELERELPPPADPDDPAKP
jgi:hypothetical protein